MKNNGNRQTTYIISVHSNTDAFAIERSVEEAENYLEQYPDRKAIIVSGKYRNDNIPKEKHTQIMHFRNKGKLKLIDKNGTNDQEVLEAILYNFKNGLLIIHKMQFDEKFLDNLINYHNKNIDVIIHRKSLQFSQAETNYFNKQVRVANKFVKENANYKMPRRIIVRLHNDFEFSCNKENMINYMTAFGEKIGYTLFLCQFILLKKRFGYRRELEEICKQHNEKYQDYIDPSVFNKETANFIYIDLQSLEILGNADEKLKKESEQELIKYFSQKISE